MDYAVKLTGAERGFFMLREEGLPVFLFLTHLYSLITGVNF
jgi:hypothetical protein